MSTAPSQPGGGLAPNLASLLCYICSPLTGLIFVLIEKENQDVRFHAWQSIFVGAAFIVIGGVIGIFVRILLSISLSLGIIGTLFNLVYSLAVLGLWIFLMIKAYQGERFKVPFLGDLAEKQLGAQ